MFYYLTFYVHSSKYNKVSDNEGVGSVFSFNYDNFRIIDLSNFGKKQRKLFFYCFINFQAETENLSTYKYKEKR